MRLWLTMAWSCVHAVNDSALQFCEMSFWVGIWLFAVASTGSWIEKSGLGMFTLILNFNASTAFSEGLSARKYPAYAAYQAAVSRLIPWLPRKPKWD